MSDRVRLTERNYSPKTGAFGKQADPAAVNDPYTMNQERRPGSNPDATKYETGTPDTWAETPISEDRWKAEYQKGRNEIGVGNFLDNTWKDREHPASPGAPKPQYENKAASEAALRQAAEERAGQMASAKKLASKALHLSHAIFPKATEKFIFAQARDFMMLPEAALDSTIARILKAGEEDEEKEDKTSGEMPEAFKKQIEKNKDKADDKDDKKEASTLASDVTRLSSRLATLKKAVRTAGEDSEEEKEEKEASLQLIASLERRLAGLKAKLAGEEKEEDKTAGAEKEEDEDKTASRLQAAAARLAGRPVKGGEEDEDEDKTAGAEKEEDEDKKTAGEEMDEEIAKEASNGSDIEIELDAPSMEVASDKDLLDDIFTTASSKVASAARPAKKGVSKIGGSTKTAGTNGGIDDLSKLWKSDPDVTGDFR